MFTDDLPTPCLLVDQARLERNMCAMQQRADANGVALRPHTKTHKSVAIAARQRALGAAGLTVAKPSEAALFVGAGFENVRVAYVVVGEEKWALLRSLMEKARVSFLIDTPEGARGASAFFAAQGRRAEVLVEVDTGHGRCGVPWDHPDAVAFVRFASSLPGLKVQGILTHGGFGYAGPLGETETPAAALQRAAAWERDRMLDLADRLQRASVPNVRPGEFEVSIGSTPTMRAFENAAREGFRISEIRPGNYVFNDAMQVGLGVAEPEDCALTVLATVVSKHRKDGRERAFIDAGKKILTTDGGFGTDGHGLLLYNPTARTLLPHARIAALSEEHGWVEVPGGATLSVGDRVQCIPNHACVTMDTQDSFYLVDGDDVLERLPIDARGLST